MDVSLLERPSFGKGGLITMKLTDGNRVYGRIESLQLCLASKGFEYSVYVEIKPGSKKLKLKPLGKMVITDCNHLESILEACGFTMRIQKS